jgi:hypothetical protein
MSKAPRRHQRAPPAGDTPACQRRSKVDPVATGLSLAAGEQQPERLSVVVDEYADVFAGSTPAAPT